MQEEVEEAEDEAQRKELWNIYVNMQHYFWLPSVAIPFVAAIPDVYMSVLLVHTSRSSLCGKSKKANLLSNDSVTFVYGKFYIRIAAYK